MSELEDKLNAVLNDPKMMQQLMSMAQSLGSKEDGIPDLDPGMLRKISTLASQGTIDRNQLTLLKALHPYLSKERIHKLEKAMRAARMAKMASSVLSSGALQL